MFKVLKNLKESWIQVICIILLLCVQAIADLKLPNYTSDIVNVGIQQNGIENEAPSVIRKKQLDNLLLFTDKDESIISSYNLLEKNEGNIKKYPVLENEDVYEIKSISKNELENLNDIIKRPMMLLNLLNEEEIANKIKESMLENMPNAEDIPNVKEMSIMEIIKFLPDEAKTNLIKQLFEKIDDMSDSIISQGAIAGVKNEYQAIGIDTSKLTNKYIRKAGLKMLVVALIIMSCAIFIMYFSSKVAAKFGKTLRNKVFKKVLSFSNEEFNKFSTASLITRSTNDIQQIQQLLAVLFRVVFYAPIVAIGGIIIIVKTANMNMAWIIGLAVFIIMITVIILFGIAVPKFKIMQSLIDKLNLVAREILTGIPVIRAFNTQDREEKRFEQANKNLMNNSIFVNNVMSLMNPLMSFIMQSILLLIIWVGGHEINDGFMQVGDMMAFLSYTMQILFSFLMISMISIMLPRAQVSANRINEILDTDEKIKDLPKNNQKSFDESKKGLVEFKNVSFKYPDGDEEVISDISFTAKKGETTAIIGSTGSGKSSIVNLIPRFYDVTGGDIYIDGVNVKDVPQKELHKRIGFVPQKGVLFSGTIESNIKYGKDISEDEMINIADIAQATDFIELKDKKYKSEISQGGNNVSGGQKQRLSIARALATDPEIYVFDDSFSALDLKTDRKLREALKNKVSDKTIIIVAQRVGTIMDAEQILVLEDGKLVGKGTHEELLENCETYKQIAISQLSEEELNASKNSNIHSKNGGEK